MKKYYDIIKNFKIQYKFNIFCRCRFSFFIENYFRQFSLVFNIFDILTFEINRNIILDGFRVNPDIPDVLLMVRINIIGLKINYEILGL